MRILMLSVAFAALAACGTVMEPRERSARQQADYDRLLAGKAAGEPQRCLPTNRASSMTVVDDHTLLFRDGRTVYVNTPIGGCHGASGLGRFLVTRNFGAQMCRGDLATVADSSTGMTVGSCALGEFVPYRTPRG